VSQAPHYGARRDESEAGVVRAFETGGASVKKINGKDVPDLLVGFLRETHLVECKTNRAKLRDGQVTFTRTWLGSPVIVVRTPAQARKWLAVWRERAESTRITFPRGGSWQALEDESDSRDAPLPAGKDLEKGGA
jgi:hypothetical protein